MQNPPPDICSPSCSAENGTSHDNDPHHANELEHDIDGPLDNNDDNDDDDEEEDDVEDEADEDEESSLEFEAARRSLTRSSAISFSVATTFNCSSFNCSWR